MCNKTWLWFSLWLLLAADPITAQEPTVVQSYDQKNIDKNVVVQCPTASNMFGDYLVAHLKANLPDAVMIDDISSGSALGEMEARVGVMKRFSTLSRVGDVVMGTDEEDDSITVHVNVTFGEFVVEYEHYQFKQFQSQSFGSMVAKAYGTLIELQLRVSPSSICYLEVIDIVIHSLDDFRVQFHSQCKNCPKIRAGIMENMIRGYKDKIRFDTNTRLLHSLPAVIRLNRAICSRLKDGV